jgi:S-adenosylmethionine synthetase
MIDSDRYGPAPKNEDTAINILLDVVQDQSGKTYKMDHYATRFPTNVIDIGNFLVRLTRAYLCIQTG